MKSLEPWVLRDAGCADRAALDAWQMARLREAVAFARANSRFYRDLLRGVDEAALRTRGDLPLLPFTTAEQLRERGADWLCRPAQQVARIVTLKTSGTTAAPKRVFFTETDLERTVDFFAHGMPELIGPGDRVGVLMPAAQDGSVGDLLCRALARIPAAAIPLGPVADIAETYAALREARCSCIVGIPVQVLGLAEYGARLPEGERLGLRSVLLSADAAPDALIRRVGALAGCAVFTHFGMTELGFGGAVECSAHAGCHVRESDILAEVVDPETGAPLPDGETGELVFTTLRREAMPFLRYRSGDLGRLRTERCACGSILHRIEPAGGRIDARAGGVSLWELDERLFSCAGVVDHETRLAGGVLCVTACGIEPPDRAALLAALDGWPVRLTCRSIRGFRGGGMEKRTIRTETT